MNFIDKLLDKWYNKLVKVKTLKPQNKYISLESMP